MYLATRASVSRELSFNRLAVAFAAEAMAAVLSK